MYVIDTHPGHVSFYVGPRTYLLPSPTPDHDHAGRPTREKTYDKQIRIYYWATVCDAGPILNKHCFNVSRLPDIYHPIQIICMLDMTRTGHLAPHAASTHAGHVSG